MSRENVEFEALKLTKMQRPSVFAKNIAMEKSKKEQARGPGGKMTMANGDAQ